MGTTITCVIPTHRRSEFLRASLHSVLGQSRPPDEVLVVSDVTDPLSAEVCREAQQGSEVSIRYIESPNARGGASSSRNAGARAASSALLAFLDDDDEWCDGYLREAVALLEGDPPADAVVTWLEMFSGEVSAPGPSIRAGLLAAEVICMNPGATGSNILLTRAAFEAIGGFDEELPVKNDTDFFYRLLNDGARYAVNENRLVRQRKHDQGQLTAKSEMRAAGVERYIAKHRSSLTRSQLNTLAFSIHRMRRHSSTSRRARLLHTLLAARHYSWAQFLDDRRHRNMGAFWNVAGFSPPGGPQGG